MLLTSEKLSTDSDFYSSRFTYSDIALQMSRYVMMCADAYLRLETWADVRGGGHAAVELLPVHSSLHRPLASQPCRCP
ncbi:hypothetical protein OBBRIDRAFT_789065 [Obba rivulosa]|uniref:Uncharacterized protein n=1 Tax=Obba rivulosa TaxID=1052685 RepID=A0A8E2DRR2_9APHY|nr:hypothetical protein OBBRIDRAFT_789065 [Obba rivulosa]